VVEEMGIQNLSQLSERGSRLREDDRKKRIFQRSPDLRRGGARDKILPEGSFG